MLVLHARRGGGTRAEDVHARRGRGIQLAQRVLVVLEQPQREVGHDAAVDAAPLDPVQHLVVAAEGEVDLQALALRARVAIQRLDDARQRLRQPRRRLFGERRPRHPEIQNMREMVVAR
jgi:hypothetical protein